MPFKQENSGSTVYCWSFKDYEEKAKAAGADKFIMKGALGLYHVIKEHKNSFLKQISPP